MKNTENEKLTEANGCRLELETWTRVNELAETLSIPTTVLMRIMITMCVEDMDGQMDGARLKRFMSALHLERGRMRARKRSKS